VAIVTPDNKGSLLFKADDATLHGAQLKLEEQGGKSDIGFWDNGSEWISWPAQITTSGAYKVSATVATVFNDAEFVVDAGGETLAAKVPVTGGWDQFQTIEPGQIQIKQAGNAQVKIRARDASTWKAINLNSLRLVPVTQP
jgi:hypothetical protein